MSRGYRLTLDQRRAIMDAANQRGLTVKGRDGEKLPARVSGACNDFAGVHVSTPFGDVTAEFAWATIQRATDRKGELQL